MTSARTHTVLSAGRRPRADAAVMTVRVAIVALGVLLIAAGWGWWTLPGMAALVAATLVAVVPERIVVGDDGVLLPRRVFVPYGRVADVRAYDRGLRLVLRSGAVVDLVTSARGHPFSQRDAARDAILDDLVARRRAWSEAPEVEVAASLALAPGGEGYRSAMVPRDHLWSIAASPRADEDARDAAVAALLPALDDRERRRLRQLAESCASPRLRSRAPTL
ncbi:MAG TPA: hypothetical protein VIF15_20450 [Polyangiaceae bacterium]|jgi:hypothetical protein